jgi:hypothetical protein
MDSMTYDKGRLVDDGRSDKPLSSVVGRHGSDDGSEQAYSRNVTRSKQPYDKMRPSHDSDNKDQETVWREDAVSRSVGLKTPNIL